MPSMWNVASANLIEVAKSVVYTTLFGIMLLSRLDDSFSHEKDEERLWLHFGIVSFGLFL